MLHQCSLSTSYLSFIFLFIIIYFRLLLVYKFPQKEKSIQIGSLSLSLKDMVGSKETKSSLHASIFPKGIFLCPFGTWSFAKLMPLLHSNVSNMVLLSATQSANCLWITPLQSTPKPQHVGGNDLKFWM